MTATPQWRLEFVRKETGRVDRVVEYASPYLAEQARKVADKADDAHLFRRRVVGPNPWPHL